MNPEARPRKFGGGKSANIVGPRRRGNNIRANLTGMLSAAFGARQRIFGRL